MDRNDDMLQNLVPSNWDINELARILRQERLFVISEQQELQTLNEKVNCRGNVIILFNGLLL